jgi:phage tail-like protein
VAAVTERPESESTYLDYLPAVFRDGAAPGEPGFLGRYLLGFEHVLTGTGDPDEPGIEERLEGIPAAGLAGIERYFEAGPDRADGERAPADFLPWLAGWVALALRSDLDELRRRELIARAVPLYRLRGTKNGLEQLVGVYTRMGVTVAELGDRFQLGVNSRVGVDTVLGGGAPHFFRVVVRLPTTDPAELVAQRRLITAIVDAEKPAYSHYTLDVETPTLQIGVTSTVGVDTLLGAESE